MPGYRLPIIAETHDSTSCSSKRCSEYLDENSKRSVKLVCKLAQRVQREATGYYCGYTFKPQPVGESHMKKISESFNYLREGDFKEKSLAQIHHRVSHKVFQDLQHRCMLRTAPEEWNLAANWHEQDVTNAEFIRTYMDVSFPGWQLRERLRLECSKDAETKSKKVLPSLMGTDCEKFFRHFPDLYGYRGNNVRVYYLSPWDFLMHWTVKSVPSQSEDHNISFWVEGWSREALQGARPEPGVHFEINEEIESDTILLFPKEYRHSWYMDENKFLLVPAPASSDLPDRQKN